MFSILDRYENHNATHKEGVYCPKNETPNAMGRFMNLFLNKNKFIYIQDILLETQPQNQILTKSGISLALFLYS